MQGRLAHDTRIGRRARVQPSGKGLAEIVDVDSHDIEGTRFRVDVLTDCEKAARLLRL